MSQKIVEVPGYGDVEFPDSMSDDAISAVIKANMSGNPPQPAAPAKMSPEQQAAQIAKTKAGLATQQQYSQTQPGLGWRVLDAVMNTQKPQGTLNPYQPNFGENLLGGMVLGSKTALPTVTQAAKTMIPSTEVGGRMLQQIENAVGENTPVSSSAAEQVGKLSQLIKERGGAGVPPPIKAFMKRMAPTGEIGGTPVAAEPLTYGESFDFASNAKDLSAKALTRLNRKQSAALSRFIDALQSANREAADKVGMGELFDDAMKEYRQGMSLQQKAEWIRKWSIPAAIGSLIGAKGYQIYRGLTGQ